MRSRHLKHRRSGIAAAAFVSMLLATAWGAPGAAIGSPDTATPSSGSPAGTEYGLPFAQGRQAGGGGGSHHGGGSTGTGFPGGSGGGGGGAGATGNLDLFGAGILPATDTSRASGRRSHAGGSRSGGSSGSGPGKALRGASNAVRDTVASARAVADRAAAGSGKADGQVALIVVLLLAAGAALALGIRFFARRVPPAGAT